MKITRSQLRKIILEQKPDFEISGDSSAAAAIVASVSDYIDQEGGAVDPEDEGFSKKLEDEGIDAEKKGAFIDKYLARLRGGDVTDREQIDGALATENKITRMHLRQLIIEELAKLPIYKKYTYGVDDIPDAGKAEDDIIGHTWLTHVKRKDSALNEIGEVLWHSLDRNGNTKLYDVLWESGNLEQDIHLSELKTVRMQEHEHKPTDEGEKKKMPSGIAGQMSIGVSEAKKKSKKRTKRDPRKDYLYPYAYGIGRRRDYEEDEDDLPLDMEVFSDAGSFDGGGEGGGGE